ncbi:MAG TPA: hypothetical protein VL576_02740 [Candidatus Paceibacterota bacterium]|jgi:hypothetical protein|nr:hypothetical protein [Candidatus Paceibacterota bacterium]
MKDEDQIAEFMKRFTTHPSWFIDLQKKAAKVCIYLHLIPTLTVDYSRPFNDAIVNTTGHERDELRYDNALYKIGDLYQLPSQGTVNETVVLARWSGHTHKELIDWGIANNLRLSTPFVPFVIGDQFPKLHHDLFSHQIMLVQETTGCMHHSNKLFCHVLWDTFPDSTASDVLAENKELRSPSKGGDWSVFLK